MLGWLKNLVSSKRPLDARRLSLNPTATDRLNAKHWADVKDESINVTLAREIGTLRARSLHESLFNPLVKGLIKTFRDDVVGVHGPTLQVQSEDDDYNDSLEQVWREWWAAPDFNAQLSGVDVLRLSMKHLWTAGDYLWQIVTDVDASTPIKMRLLMIHPRRLSSPLDLVVDANVTMGIEHTDSGRPLFYNIEDEQISDGSRGFSFSYARIPAEFIIHGFERLECDQMRGMPWLASVLPVIAGLAEYDQAVMDAAHMAAALSVLLFTKEIPNNFTEISENVELERGTMSTLPPGYEAMQIKPSQPGARYKEFVDVQKQKLGRPVGMPLLTVNLDARGHSWSSARLDRDVYHSGIRTQQGDTDRTGLNRVLRLVAREAELTGLISPMRSVTPARYAWTWPVFPSIDPQKETTAAGKRIQFKISSEIDEIVARGGNPEAIVENMKRWKELLKAAGIEELPPPNMPRPPVAATPAQPATNGRIANNVRRQ